MPLACPAVLRPFIICPPSLHLLHTRKHAHLCPHKCQYAPPATSHIIAVNNRECVCAFALQDDNLPVHHHHHSGPPPPCFHHHTDGNSSVQPCHKSAVHHPCVCVYVCVFLHSHYPCQAVSVPVTLLSTAAT